MTGFDSQEKRDQHEAAHVRKYRCKVLNCFMGKQGFKKQHDLKLHRQKYHPPTQVPELVLSSTLTPVSLSHPDIFGGLTISYAPHIELPFSVALLYQFKFHSVCYSTAISPDQLFFATATKRFIHLCSLETGKEVGRFDMGVRESTDSNNHDYVFDVCFTPDGLSLIGAGESRKIMVCCSCQICGRLPISIKPFVLANDRIQIWNLATKECRATGVDLEESIDTIAVSSDGAYVASAGADMTARVWDMSGSEIAKFQMNDFVHSITFFPDQRFLLVGCQDKVSIINWRESSLVTNLQGHMKGCYGVDILPKSGKIVLGSLDNSVLIWNVSPQTDFNYSVEKTLRGHTVRL